MPEFNAAKAVTEMRWDFTKYQPPAGEGGPGTPAARPWKGVIAEPSQGDIKAFQDAVRQSAPTGDPERLSEVDSDDVFEALKEAVVQLCRDQPSRAMLDELPFRVLTAFVGWLTGQLANPR